MIVVKVGVYYVIAMKGCFYYEIEVLQGELLQVERELCTAYDNCD
jgi:hypothetical protein